MRIIKIFIFILTFQSFSQNFNGEATYKTFRKVDLKLSEDPNMNGQMKTQIEEQMRKLFQKTYTLKFNNYISIYKENEKLEGVQNSNVNVMMIGGNNSDDIYYKNLKENRFVNKTEISGKLFLIKDTLSFNNWTLHNETKSIGVYTCSKATFSREVDDVKMEMVNNKIEKTIGKKELTTTVWYTSQIPVNNGPAEFYGLPGLILEVQENDLTIVCTKVNLNKETKIEIEEPKKGKVVSLEKFNEIQEKKNEEFLNRMTNKDGHIEINIGG